MKTDMQVMVIIMTQADPHPMYDSNQLPLLLGSLTSQLDLYFTILPMTELLDGPKAQIHCDPPGTSNLQKLHLLLKYLGRKEADARLQDTTKT
ncbi:hypothetical protein E2C01_023132 [Portunus trituberculatus]|uniref:Uncharacterized protein n=1 Tax=Portunus trituberculatus TaxID=210409 RepID=A0A5B7E769_PORTR|nr:hypothetical protein [Portunus trituberculatus]